MAVIPAHHPRVTSAPPDPWLEPFLDSLRATGARILDAGCGAGLDAAYLAARGFTVTAFDRRQPPAHPWRPPVSFLLADVCAMPFRPGRFDAVIASLSLHYLPWQQTLQAFSAAGELVRPGGRFLFRVNASDDLHHGAGQGEEIEPGFFRVPGSMVSHSETKRFFTESDARAAVPRRFAIDHLAHRTIRRYDNPKQVWECLLTREA